MERKSEPSRLGHKNVDQPTLSGLLGGWCKSAQRSARVLKSCVYQANRGALGPILEQIASLTERIRDYDQKLETISKESYPETGLLRQVEGIGALTALTFLQRHS